MVIIAATGAVTTATVVSTGGAAVRLCAAFHVYQVFLLWYRGHLRNPGHAVLSTLEVGVPRTCGQQSVNILMTWVSN